MTCKEKILSEDYQDILTSYFVEGDRDVETDRYCAIPISDRLWSVYYNRAYLPQLSFADYNYRFVTEIYGLMDVSFPEVAGGGFDPQPLVHSGITAVQREPLLLTGRNVVIGFADTGIDYRNPVFRRADGSTRILAIWDQTIQDGTPPEGFEYGSEYTQDQINEALKLEEPLDLVPTEDEIGHGTATAAAAAGSALNGGLGFIGVAPDADLVVVKLKQAKEFIREFYMLPREVPAYEANDIALAVKYINSFLIPYARPVVTCLGVGRSFGAHQGTSSLDRYLSDVSLDFNRAVVVAGGNEGNTGHHYFGNVEGADPVNVEMRVEEDTKGFLVEIWGNIPNYFNVVIRSPGGEEVPTISSRVKGKWEYRFVYDKTQVQMDYQLNDQITGTEVAVLRFEDPSPGIWTLQFRQENRNDTGFFHMWLPIRQFVEGRVEFLQPSPETTLTSPSYATAVLTVSAYNSRNNSFYVNSGQGFGPQGEIKPELAAPGVDISTVEGMLRGRAVVGSATGTSMSAGLTSGACALVLQWAVGRGNYSDINGVGVKNYLIRGAAQDAAYRYPSPQWGYGRLDMEGTFDWIAGI